MVVGPRKPRNDETALPTAKSGYEWMTYEEGVNNTAAVGLQQQQQQQRSTGLVQCANCGRCFAEDRIVRRAPRAHSHTHTHARAHTHTHAHAARDVATRRHATPVATPRGGGGGEEA